MFKLSQLRPDLAFPCPECTSVPNVLCFYYLEHARDRLCGTDETVDFITSGLLCHISDACERYV